MEVRRRHSAPSLVRFAVFAAAVVTALMLLFPPFTSVSGTEYAFVASGPEWASHAGTLGSSLRLSPSIHWPLLVAQLAALWLLVLGAWRFLLVPGQ